ncbi:hypothetical protein BDN70DRAFT_706756 [Pholiota conissans]|uniref:Required for respiratory growth protein 9, mitochondrial n=1 Tax=Pholiota conissans TaxID=109636 RepID=A0A9P5ZBK5_9AGAR|nr:hypothetical protein BDN70DRAFT_706756 [Pholiota conissans]
MFSWIRTAACTRHVRNYTASAPRASTSKWQLAGVPKPRSILDDDDAVIDLSEDNDVVNGFRPGQPPPHLRRPSAKPTPHEYKAHRATLRKSFPEGWSPPHKLSRQAMDALRDLHRADPATFTAPILADRFKISPEAVRRILKSKWTPSAAKQTSRAISERREQQVVAQQRVHKEQDEMKNLVELRKHSRHHRAAQGKVEEGVETGISRSDTFTFR